MLKIIVRLKPTYHYFYKPFKVFWVYCAFNYFWNPCSIRANSQFRLTDPEKEEFWDSIGNPFYLQELDVFIFLFIEDSLTLINNVFHVTIFANLIESKLRIDLILFMSMLLGRYLTRLKLRFSLFFISPQIKLTE